MPDDAANTLATRPSPHGCGRLVIDPLKLATGWRLTGHTALGPDRLLGWRAIFALTFALAAGPCDALRMINLDAPQTARQGDTIQLRCAYQLATGLADAGQRLGRAPSRPQQPRYDDDRPRVEPIKWAANRPPAQVLSRSWTPSGSRQLADDLEPTKLRNSSSLAGPIGKQEQPATTTDAGPSARQWEFKRSASLAYVADSALSSSPESLYALKWYKDGREFFRYLSQDWPPKQVLPLDGLHVDMDKSDNQTVTLRNVSLRTSGLFKCEVSTDAPFFVTKSIERNMLVYHLPGEGPLIESHLIPVRGQLVRQLAIGDQAEFRCTSRESKPASQIDWIVNQSLNLSSFVPLNGNGAPIFHLARKQLVRLAVPSGPMRHKSPGQQLKASQSGSNVDSVDSVVAPVQQQTITYATYQLEPKRDGQRLFARPVSADPSSPAEPLVDLDDGSLDQLLELSSSTLNFSVNTDLLQLLAKLETTTSSGAKQLPLQPADTQVQQASPWSRRRTLVSNKTQGIGPSPMAKKSARLGWRPISGNQTINRVAGESVPRLYLNIKCVARLLHLAMSDEIKLQLIDKTRLAGQSNEEVKPTSIELHQSEASRNSGVGVQSITFGSRYVTPLIVFTCTAHWFKSMLRGAFQDSHNVGRMVSL